MAKREDKPEDTGSLAAAMWGEIFAQPQRCDFCYEPGASIAVAVIKPIYERDEGKVYLCGVATYKKCYQCVEKDLEEDA